MHRDIKASNVLIRRLEAPSMGGSRTWELRICDFGLARSIRVEGPVTPSPAGPAVPAVAVAYSAQVFTPSYRPLEVAVHNCEHSIRHDGRVGDMHSVACVIAELLMLLEDGPGRCLGGLLNPVRGGAARRDAKGCIIYDDPANEARMIMGVLSQSPTEGELAELKQADASIYGLVVRAMEALLPGPRGHPVPPLESILPRAPPEALSLLRSMMAINPSRRLSADAALAHPFFAPLRTGASAAAYAAEHAATAAAAAALLAAGDPAELHCAGLSPHGTVADMRIAMEAEVRWWRGGGAGGGGGGGGM